MQHFDVIIIGAGAAGLMCAATAGRRGRSVLVLEHTAKPGKKILMSGGGRCNFTNLDVGPANYLCPNPHFVRSALAGYTHWDFIALVNEYAIPYHERDLGKLFCDVSAKDILKLLLSECDKAGVEIRTRVQTEGIDAVDGGFRLVTDKGELTCESLVIATGGLSIPTMGEVGFGYRIAEQFGMRVLPTRAGLVPFTFTDRFGDLSERLSGIAIEVRLYNDKAGFTENILFTHRGLSGPAALQLSNYWQPGEAIHLDLLPHRDVEQHLLGLKQSQPKVLLRTLLAQDLPRSLVLELQALWWPERAETPIAEWPDKALKELSARLTDWTLKPAGTEGYRTAEVTLGGVDTDQLSSKTLESKVQPGLYFIGETVDVTGWLGGYNFQWAWSSGVAAGKAA